MQRNKLGQLVQITIGRTPSRSNSDYWDTLNERKNTWLSIADMLNLNGKFVSDSKEQISDEAAGAFSHVPKGTLLVSFKLTLGRLAFAGRDLWTNEAIAALRNDESTILNDYLYYYLSYFNWTNYAAADNKVKGLTLNKAKLYEIDIYYPQSLKDQRNIVRKLDAAFGKLDNAIKLTSENVTNSQRLFEYTLTNIMASQASGSEMKTLNEISIDFGRGKSKHRPRNDKKLYGGKYPFIQTGDVRNSEHTIIQYNQTYSEFGLSQSKLWPKGTICITIAANIAETGILGFDACFPDSVIGIVVDPAQANIDYVEYLLQSFKVRLQALGKGSAQDNINLGTFEKHPFPFPSIKQQQRIVAELNKLLAQTKALESAYRAKEEAMQHMKRSILKQLLPKGDVE